MRRRVGGQRRLTAVLGRLATPNHLPCGYFPDHLKRIIARHLQPPGTFTSPYTRTFQTVGHSLRQEAMTPVLPASPPPLSTAAARAQSGSCVPHHTPNAQDGGRVCCQRFRLTAPALVLFWQHVALSQKSSVLCKFLFNTGKCTFLSFADVSSPPFSLLPLRPGHPNGWHLHSPPCPALAPHFQSHLHLRCLPRASSAPTPCPRGQQHPARS